MTSTLNLTKYLQSLQIRYNRNRPSSGSGLSGYHRFLDTQQYVTGKLHKLFAVLDTINQPDELSYCEGYIPDMYDYDEHKHEHEYEYEAVDLDVIKIFTLDSKTFTSIYWTAIISSIGYAALIKLTTKLHLLQPNFINEADVCTSVFDDLGSFADLNTILFYVNLFKDNLRDMIQYIVIGLHQRLEPNDSYYISPAEIDQILSRISSHGYKLYYNWFNDHLPYAPDLSRVSKMFDLFASYRTSYKEMSSLIRDVFGRRYRYNRDETMCFIRKIIRYAKPDMKSIIALLFVPESTPLQQIIDTTEIIQLTVMQYPDMLQIINTIDFMLEQMMVYLHDSQTTMSDALNDHIFSRYAISIFPDVCDKIKNKYYAIEFNQTGSMAGCCSVRTLPLVNCYGMKHDKAAVQFLKMLERPTRFGIYFRGEPSIEVMATICSNVKYWQLLTELKADALCDQPS